MSQAQITYVRQKFTASTLENGEYVLTSTEETVVDNLELKPGLQRSGDFLTLGGVELTLFDERLTLRP